jgi:Fe-S cluster biogenesis protein NfuA
MTTKDKKEIEKLVGKFRILVKTHGGDVKLVSITEKTVELDLLGTCVSCPLANLSYDVILGGMIREKFPGVEIKFKKIIKKRHAKLKRIHKKQA